MASLDDSLGLSQRQHQAFEALRAFQQEQGFPPTRAELGALLGVSAQTADFHLRALEKKGVIQRSGQARGLSFVPLPQESSALGVGARVVPLVGQVAAGKPFLAVENLEGRLPLPEGSGADFALRVVGDSMVEAGILDGDMVLVEQSKDPCPGDIVVALLGDGETQEATVKHYYPEKRCIILRPAHPTMKDIVVKKSDHLALAGRVVGVLRLWD
ncbi:MAG: transcriptional repressor LexA [Planctomycetota bacterium]|nr:transcriptional repressor LexA [Planctomycetota bacterium]